VDAVPEPAATGSLVDDGHAFQPPESYEAAMSVFDEGIRFADGDIARPPSRMRWRTAMTSRSRTLALGERVGGA